MFGLEGVLRSNNFPFKVCCECRVILGKAFDAEIPTQERLIHVDMLDVDLNLIDLSIRLLGTPKLAAGEEE